MEAAGIGSSTDSTWDESPSQCDERDWYETMRDGSPTLERGSASWDPYMPQVTESVEVPTMVRSIHPSVVQSSRAAGSLASTVSSLLHIFHTLTIEAHSPVKLPFRLDMLTVATRDASTLSHCLNACHVASDSVFELGFGLWKTQHVTEDPESLHAMTAVLQEGLMGKSTCYMIAFFRKVLDDTCTDKFHEAILEMLKKLIPDSILARHWKCIRRMHNT